MLTIGEKAPAFKLLNQDNKIVSLVDYRTRWVVLYFYPRDDTPGCTKEAHEFTASIGGFEKLDAVVLGCSPDSPDHHRVFIKKQKLKVTLLSDPSHVVMEKYGAWGEKVLYGKTTVGVKRSTVAIDPAGKVAYHWRAVRVAGHVNKVQEKIAELAKRSVPGR